MLLQLYVGIRRQEMSGDTQPTRLVLHLLDVRTSCTRTYLSLAHEPI